MEDDTPSVAFGDTSPIEGEEGAKLDALPPLDGEGAERSEAGGVRVERIGKVN